jgi:hypothetical protein
LEALVTGAQNRDRGEVDSGNAASANAKAGRAYRDLTVFGEANSWLTRQDRLDKPKRNASSEKGESVRCGICPR